MKRVKSTLILLVLISIIAIPPLFTLTSIVKYGVNVPVMDDWVIIDFIVLKSDGKLILSNLLFEDISKSDGKLTLSDLLSQDNEHRVLFPRIILIGLAEITKFNTVDVMYFSWFLSIITFLLLFVTYTEQLKISAFSLAMFIPVSMLFFTPRQSHNILMGYNIEYYLLVLGFVVSIYFLNRTNNLDNSFLLSAIGSIITSFTFLNGLLIWIIGVMIIILKSSDKRKLLLVVWGIIGSGTYLIYFWGWVRPSYLPKFGFDINYFIISTSSPLTWKITDSFYIGILILFVYVAVILYLIKRRNIKDNIMWIFLIVFSVMTSIMLTIGRSGFGEGQAISSRYLTFLLLGVSGAYIILIKILKEEHKYVCLLIAAILMIGMYFNYIEGMKEEENWHHNTIIMEANLFNYKNVSDNNLTIYPYPDAKSIRERAKVLEYYNWSVFNIK